MELSAEMILYGYSIGVFPMADPEENNEISWYAPDVRGILPLHNLKISKSMQQTLRSNKFHLTINTNFSEVIRQCAHRDETWISQEIIYVFEELHEMGYAHSFETRDSQHNLVGGLYGVAMGKVFFGESMFHTQRDASKFALIKLVEWMRGNHFELLDTQYITPHLQSMGAIEVSKTDYMILLQQALT
jgi:leucyl/phenylalanyl-tRNA--protein transferase